MREGKAITMQYFQGATKEAEMDNYRAVALAEGFEDGTREEQIEAWQHLIDTGLAWSLQGWFGRTARDLIEQGII